LANYDNYTFKPQTCGRNNRRVKLRQRSTHAEGHEELTAQSDAVAPKEVITFVSERLYKLDDKEAVQDRPLDGFFIIQLLQLTCAE